MTLVLFVLAAGVKPLNRGYSRHVSRSFDNGVFQSGFQNEWRIISPLEFDMVDVPAKASRRKYAAVGKNTLDEAKCSFRIAAKTADMALMMSFTN